MANSAPFDQKTLAAVKPGLSAAFTDISAGVEQYFEAPATQAPSLVVARGQLHGLLGVLKMAGLDGLAVFCNEMDSVLGEFSNGAQQPSTMSRHVLRRALLGVTQYLDALSSGGDNATLRLFPQYQELQQLRGLEMSFKLDLFYPNLAVPLPQPMLDIPMRPDAVAHLKFLRSQFQQNLLRLLRNDNVIEAAQHMQQVVSEAISCTPQNNSRAFWWIAHALFECVKLDDIPEEINIRKLLGRVDQQMRAVAEGGGSDAHHVVNEMLYVIGNSQVETEPVIAIKRWYSLPSYLPNQLALSLGEIEQARATMREQLHSAQENWERAVQGDEVSCGKFKTGVEQLSQEAKKLDAPALQSLVQDIQKILVNISSCDHTRPVAIDMAMTLLLLGSGIENYTHLDEDFQEQAHILAGRMRAVAEDQPEDVQQFSRLVELHYQTNQSSVITPLANEMLINLQRVEQSLNVFFGDQTERGELGAALRMLGQVNGGLNMLALPEAAELLGSIRNEVQSFTQNGMVPGAEKSALLAEAVGRLENYLQHWAHGQTPDVALLKALPAKAAKAAPSPVAPVVEPAPAAIEQPAAEQVAAPSSTPNEIEFTRTEPAVVEPVAAVSEPVLELTPVAIQPPEVSEAPAAEPVPSVAVEMEYPAVEDQELLDVFLEEAKEVLASIESHFQQCVAQPADQNALTVIRRGFHTFKGSGRMVGLNHFGEAAWGVERALNNWLQARKPATPGLLGFVELAKQAFAGWVDELGKQGGVRVDAAKLMQIAQQIENGQEPALSTAPEVAPVLQMEQPQVPVTEMAPPVLDMPPIAAPRFELESVVEPPIASVSPPGDGLPDLHQMAEPISEPAVAGAAEEAEASEEMVTIGDKTLPSSLFNIATAESMENVALLQEQLDGLRAAGEPEVQYDFMRAAHTLVGLNQAMGFDAAVELAHALESWSRAHLEPPVTLHQQQLDVLDEAISALGDMVLNICNLQPPVARQDVADKLAADVRQTIMLSKAQEAIQPPEESARPVVQEAVLPKPAQVADEIEKPQVQDEIDAQLLPLFLEEAEDLRTYINEGLRECREQPQNQVLLQSLKRHIHTMKGSSRMVGAMRIGEIAHAMEDRVATAAAHSHEPGYWDDLEGDFDNIIALLEELHGGKPAVIVNKRALEVEPTAQAVSAPSEVVHQIDRRQAEHAVERTALGGNVLRVRSDLVDRLVNDAGEISVARSRIETELRTFKENLLELTNSVTRLRQQLREVEIQAEGQMQARVSQAKENAGQFDPLEFDRFTRLQELTRFMNESVHDVQTVQQMLLKKLDDTATVMHGQARISRELQQQLMSIRMVSFNSISDRLYRIVRQTGKELNKRANLELQGVNVELDRSVLEKMIAPFEHLLRNAMVHGLESNEARTQAGKNLIGEISLSVRQENNEVVFEFSDDGAGLNYVALRTKAIAGGLLRADEEASDEQLAQLIFTSGLSTATSVTEIAGRGVGMDVVRSEISGLGGRIDVSSVRGQGTRFVIYLPLTLAVTQIVLVRSGEHIYAIPAAMVEQVRQVKLSDMEALHKVQKVEWQGKTYPLHYLSHLLSEGELAQEIQPRNSLLLLRSGEQRLALHVDELLGNQEAVVKNIGPQLARHPGITGATVLGNGSVVMILNPAHLAQRISSGNKIIRALAEKQLNILPLIMVVDDSLTVRKITSRMLTRAGYQVVTATDGVDALEQLEEFTPDVMLLDIEMPRMDGFALAKELRRSPNTKSMPIIMITSRTADKHRDYAMQLGVNTYLGKPYQEDELLQSIADFVAVHK